MRCVICASQDIVKKSVEEELRLGNDVVLLPIEVLVCLNCGERYYDRRTMRLLEEIEDKIRAEEMDLRTVGRVLKPVAA
ncbi:MAG TPA: YgiT-type zinc finger protein [Candidatus Latescibacteria bacterium]|nr:YgiT-type zinc finger protein [Candidatus Latescibacterota bacterium]